MTGVVEASNVQWSIEASFSFVYTIDMLDKTYKVDHGERMQKEAAKSGQAIKSTFAVTADHYGAASGVLENRVTCENSGQAVQVQIMSRATGDSGWIEVGETPENTITISIICP